MFVHESDIVVMNNRRTLFLLFLLPLLTACRQGTDGSTQDQVAFNQESGDPEIAVINQRIAADPNNPALFAARARLYYDREGYDEAIDDLHHALELDSTNTEYFFLLSDVYLHYYKSREALQTLERAVGLHPKDIPTLRKLAEVQFILRQYEESMRTIDRMLKIDPQNADAFFLFGMNFKETGDTARSINSFQEAVELNPDLIDAWINLGQLNAALGNKIAERYFNTALEIAPESVEALHAKADYLRDQNRLSEAIQCYRLIAINDPQYEEAYYNAGLLYMELDSVEQAYRQFDLAIKVDPAHVRAYFFRGYAAEVSGNTSQARSDYEQALRLDPGYEQARERLRRLP